MLIPNMEIKPLKPKHLSAVSKILSTWLTKEEAEHYISSIQEIITNRKEKLKFDSHYFVAVTDHKIIGVAGFRSAHPKLLEFATTNKPAELCMLYVAKNYIGKGAGQALTEYVIEKIRKKKYKELMVRSAEKFRETGWGFYDKMEFERAGELKAAGSEALSQVWTKKI